MVKDTTTQVKKKRKTNNADNEPELDIYKKVCDFEEKEAQNRDTEEDSKHFLNTCTEIHDSLMHARELKYHSSESFSEKLDCITEIVVNVCLIKKLNRIDKLTHVSGRENLNVEKQKCDSIKLTYQNLVYELHHLVTETNKCLSFKSEDEDIELVSFEDFMKNASESVTSKFKNYNLNNPDQTHALRLARLEWELTLRKKLAEDCKIMEEKKTKVLAEMTERKEKLNDLLPLLQMVIKAAKPLQEHLGMPGDQTRKEHRLASLLPDTLYILYANIVAYKSVFDTNINVIILGDKDDATQFNEAQEVSNSSGLNEDDSEPESDLPEVEEVVEVKKRRHRKSVQQVDPMEEKKKKLLEVHPLKVELSLSVVDGPTLNIVFSYYTKLRIVTVNAKVDVPSKITANAAREILSGHNILSELLENDTGLESPNPSTGYQLRKIGLGFFQTLIPSIGYAYGWAQGVCGIDFLTPKKYCDKLSQTNVEIILKIIRKRLTTRIHLARQMQQLEQNIVPSIPDSVDSPSNAISSLSKWSSTTYQNFCQAEFTNQLIDEDIVTPSDLFYSVKILRGEATLQTFVVIKNTYPLPPPIFALNLNYNGNNYNFLNSDEIRKLLPNLEEPSLIIMVNGTYYSGLIEKIPNTTWSKTLLTEWLEQKQIPVPPFLMKDQIWKLVKQHIPLKRYRLDELALKHGHRVLRLPPYHCHFNPIEMVWSECKRYYDAKLSSIHPVTNDAVLVLWNEALEKDLERVLNVDWDYGAKSSSWLLSAQLTHLCSFLDVYLETLDPKTFPPNSKFIRSISGRNRKRPFRFRKIGTGIFTQY